MVQHVNDLAQASESSNLPDGVKRNLVSILEAFMALGITPTARLVDWHHWLYSAMAGEDVYAYDSAAGISVWDGTMVDASTGYRGVRVFVGEPSREGVR